QRPDVTDILFFQATGRRRPLVTSGDSARDLPASALAATAAIFPTDLDTVMMRDAATGRDNPALLELIKALQDKGDPETVPVLLWLFRHSDVQPYSGGILRALARALESRLPIADLASEFATADSDHRLAIVRYFTNVLRTNSVQMTRSDWDVVN